MSKRKTILFHSCGSLLNTGFSRTLRTLFTALYKKDKYNLVEYANAPFDWSDAKLNKLPWKAYGAIPDDKTEIPHNLNPQSEALLKYGHFCIDRVVKETKPDVIFMAEDIWGVAPALNKPWFKKTNSVVWTPVDSLPLMDLLKECAPIAEHLWVKAEFANKALRDIGIQHAKTIPDLIDDASFFPVPDEERANLRRQVGIEDDCLIIGFVFRNQLRKLVGTLIDGFKIYKEQNPDVKVKLLLHTDWREQQWNIQKLILDAGIKQEDVLTTYVCHSCRNVQVRPFYGQEQECGQCHQKAVFTAGVDVGVADRELNFIYNLMDVYFHPVTSGGVEMPCIESLYTGLPMATVPYASCETYTNHPDVYAFDCSYYREVNSGFLKSQPAPESVAKAIEHFYAMGREKRKETGLRLREWALEKFSVKKWVDWIENFIDELPEVNYDFEFDAQSNETYPMPVGIGDNRLFLRDLYKNIFHVDVLETDPEFNNILSALEKGITQYEIYNDLIAHAREHNSKNKKIKINDLVEKNNKKKMLYILPNTNSDCIASLPVLEELHKKYKKWDMYIATEKRLFSIFEHLPFVKKIFEYEEWMDQILKLEGQGENKGIFDIVWHPSLLTRKFHNYSHNGLDKCFIQ